jgi:hypothetical protein
MSPEPHAATLIRSVASGYTAGSDRRNCKGLAREAATMQRARLERRRPERILNRLCPAARSRVGAAGAKELLVEPVGG